MTDFEEIKCRVTIRDILNSLGYYPKKRRMACPIHRGKNRTSFSFSEHYYHCFSCGASGGLVDLLVELKGMDRRGALEYLSRLAGISHTSAPSKPNARMPTRYRPKSISHEDQNLRELEFRLEVLDILRDFYTWELKNARRRKREGTISLAAFYSATQYYDYVLEELDEEYVWTRYYKRIEMRNK
ncbi:MAG: CHC2 zinc finger domain-containing protein [Nitrospirota bacterium]